MHFLLVLALFAPDWPRFRGPNGDGFPADDKAPVEFSMERNLAYKVSVPGGNSSPILVDGKLFLTGHEGDDRFVLCYDAASGKELWRRGTKKVRSETVHPLNGPTTPTPTTDGSNVYAFLPEFGLVSYTLDGKERWRTPLGPFDTIQGVATSPVYAEGNVILFIDQPQDSYIQAFDAKTGKQRWKVERPSGLLGGYASPIVYQPAKGPVQLVIAGAVELTGYQASTGERLWWIRGLTFAPAAPPIVHRDTVYMVEPASEPDEFSRVTKYDKNKDGKVALDELSEEKIDEKIWAKIVKSIDHHYGNGDRAVDEAEWKRSLGASTTLGGLNAVKLGGSGDLTEKAAQWRVMKGMPYVTSPLLYRDVIYIIRNGGILASYNPASGEMHKQERVKDALGEYYASPVAAGGKVFLVSKEGKLSVLKAGAQWELESVVDLSEQVIATPALAKGRLYVRTAGHLYCFGS
jgi:outer membrane protein assembly factor BamB